jgi:DNA (cytosine-5)-methyltransferase 1
MAEPDTQTTENHTALFTSHLLHLNGTCKDGVPVNKPMPTVQAEGTHIGEVRAFLVAYYGNEKKANGGNQPMRTVTTKDRFSSSRSVASPTKSLINA